VIAWTETGEGKQVKERKEWAHEKALQATKNLSNDLAKLKLLRMEREETRREKKKANFLSGDDFKPAIIPPDDWDEDASMDIKDDDAVKPEGWLDD